MIDYIYIPNIIIFLKYLFNQKRQMKRYRIY